MSRLYLLGLLLPVLVARPAPAQEDVALVGVTVIDPASDEPITDATVIVVDGRIARIERGAVRPDGMRVIELSGRYLLPGLIDAHVHISSFAAARRALRSGVTTARSMGTSHFADVGLRELQRAGAIESPEIIAAGYHVRPRPADQLFMDVPELTDLLESGVHGEEAMRRLARVMIEHGVNFIKTNATERAGLPETDPRKPFYDETELRALVEEGERAGIPVAAHAHGDTGGRAAVAAGVRSIEHGTYLSDETLDLMVSRGTFLVPTIAVVADLTIPGGDYDNAVLNIRGRHMLPRVRDMAARARARGVRMVAATDTGYGPRACSA